MYYLEMIQRFWIFNKDRPIGATAISMYLYLLKTGYENDRYDFRVSDVNVGKELGLTRKTVKSTRQKLGSLGLIRYVTQNGVPCWYRLILDYPFQLLDPGKEKIIRVEETKISAKEDVIMHSQNDKSEIFHQQMVNFNKELNVQGYEPSAGIDFMKRIPTIDEFMDYASKLDTYDSALDLILKEKYESWEKSDWKNSSGRPISNWKFLLKSILPYMNSINDSDNPALNEIPKIRRPDLSK